ncbi:hypothetical protein C4569_01360 [Candidatus Parcubacteria bacterium]|nr:MAG: hypothetical protein C4569_01360 [Candidatus Parcubacteria bacterium]
MKYEEIIRILTEALQIVTEFAQSGKKFATIAAKNFIVYGDIHGEPEIARQALADAKAGNQVICLGDLAWRNVSGNNIPLGMFQTTMLLIEAMVKYNALIVRGNCDCREMMQGLYIAEVYPEITTKWAEQKQLSEVICSLMELLPIGANTAGSALVHGCAGKNMPSADAFTWSVFNPEISEDRIFEKFGPPSFEICWQSVIDFVFKGTSRKNLFIGHDKRGIVGEQGYQIYERGNYRIVRMMSSSQSGAVKRPIKCIVSGDNLEFMPL